MTKAELVAMLSRVPDGATVRVSGSEGLSANIADKAYDDASRTLTLLLLDSNDAGVRIVAEATDTKPTNDITEAGKRAAQWVVDTGDCLFCSYDVGAHERTHEEHCAFHGCSDADLRALVEAPAATKEGK